MSMKDRLKIAVMVNTKLSVGGSFSQAQVVVDELVNKRDRYDYLFLSIERSTVDYLNSRGLKAELIYKSLKHTVKSMLTRRSVEIPKSLERVLSTHGTELVYMIGPYDEWVKMVSLNYNYLFTINDLCHRDHPEFPEVYSNNEFARRERVYGGGSRYALATVVDSDVTKEKLEKLYGVTSERVITLGFGVGSCYDVPPANDDASVFQRYDIAGDYLFYPAQFWPHKNHVFILKALKLLKELHGLSIHVVFTGSDFGNRQHVVCVAESLGVGDQVHILGFVSSQEIVNLYRSSKALVMPTWFGPTNIPPLEAFKLGVPVIYSKQADEGGIFSETSTLIDLEDPMSLVAAVMSVLNDDEVVKERAENGKRFVEALKSGDYLGEIFKVFESYRTARSSWR